MIILPDQKVAFIHIYKTGGTSLTLLLAPHTDPAFRSKQPRIGGAGFQGTWHYRGAQHAVFSDPRKGFPEALQDQLSDYRFLAVVRNPYSWCHSVYLEFFRPDKKTTRGINFLFGQVSPDRSLKGFYTFWRAFRPGYSGAVGMHTQSEFLEGIPEAQFHLIRFETYAEDVRRILPELGIPVPDLPHALNRGRAKQRSEEVFLRDPEFIAFCNEAYAEDFDTLGYDRRAV